MNRRQLFPVLLEALPIFGPVAFIALFLLAYLTWTSAIPQFVALLVGAVLMALAVTPLMSGLGWIVSGRWIAGVVIFVVRGLTMIWLARAIVATDAEGCSSVVLREACTEIYATGALFIAIPLGSPVSLSLIEMRLRRTGRNGGQSAKSA